MAAPKQHPGWEVPPGQTPLPSKWQADPPPVKPVEVDPYLKRLMDSGASPAEVAAAYRNNYDPPSPEEPLTPEETCASCGNRIRAPGCCSYRPYQRERMVLEAAYDSSITVEALDAALAEFDAETARRAPDPDANRLTPRRTPRATARTKGR